MTKCCQCVVNSGAFIVSYFDKIIVSDIDLLCHWLSPATPSRVSSFGSLQHFRKAAKPTAAGNATQCLDCPMEKDCAYSAKKSMYPIICSISLYCRIHGDPAVYLDPVSQGHTYWPVSTIVDGLPDIENVTDALRNGPYGQCVYESPNDVCDHQVSKCLSHT